LSTTSVLNLIRDPWLPVRRASGRTGNIRLADLTTDLARDPIIEPAWGRADLDAATREFLIGVLALAVPPAAARDWVKKWSSPPDPAALADALASLARWFNLDGKGPRFLQDLELLDGEAIPVEALFISTVGAQGRHFNTDLFEKRDRIRVLSRSTAAIALFTLQAFSPAGGRGNRTGLRGGGPLSTLVIPGPSSDGTPVSLWRQLWANVPKGRSAGDNELPHILPWTVATRTSDKHGGVTTPEDVDERQQFFSMPRRIRLAFEENVDKRPCDVTGQIDSVVVTGFVMRPYGTQYEKFLHPLTPHFVAKEEREPVHAPDGPIGYRQWLGLVHRTNDGKRLPAACVATFFDERASNLRDLDRPAARGARLVCAGYAMDNMKALAFVEAEMPLYALLNGQSNERLGTFAARLIESAELIARLVVGAIKSALFKKAEVKFDSSVLSAAREEIWQATEPDFYDALSRAADELDSDHQAQIDSIVDHWIKRTLRDAAFHAFDRRMPLADLGVVDLTPIIEARRGVALALLGYGKSGAELYRKLGLPAPESAKTKQKSRKSRGMEASP
jgi:CRISPR system Cascade subunit CasA